MKENLTCVECPMGCSLEVEIESGRAVSVTGNNCPRGKSYAENEVVCPKRVLTSSVRMTNGQMLPVKTNAPVKKSELFALMKILNAVHPVPPVRIGDTVVKNISDGADLVATGNSEEV